MSKSLKPNGSTIRRTRSGCWNCKERRRRCTEDKPACNACVKRGLKCHYDRRLLWKDDAESMGIAFGRAGMKDRFQKNKKKTIISYYLLPTHPRSTYYWLKTTSDDITWLYNGSIKPRRMRSSTEFEVKPSGYLDYSNAILPTLTQWPALSEIDAFLFNHFSNVCTLRRSLVNDDNPWRSVVLPLCHQSQGLLHIAVAWAAHDLRNHHRDQDVTSYDEMVLRHKCRSLEYLRNMVTQHSRNTALSLAQTQGERDSLLLLVMLHCLLEIASGSIMEWTFHMKGVLVIMKFYTSLSGTTRPSLFSREVLGFVYTFFAEKDTFLATTSNDGQDLDNFEWSVEVHSMFPFLCGRDCTKVDPCMGLSPELLDIISSITSLVRWRRTGDHHGKDIYQEFMTLQHRLLRLRNTRETKELDGLIGLHAAAFEEATWIYLHHAFHEQHRQSDIIRDIHLPKLLGILERVHETQGVLLGLIPYPMWALFIASCVVPEEERVKILEWFTILKRNRPISNVPSTMAAVEAIWKRKDLELDDACSLSSQYSVHWGAAISQLGWKMPLT